MNDTNLEQRCRVLLASGPSCARLICRSKCANAGYGTRIYENAEVVVGEKGKRPDIQSVRVLLTGGRSACSVRRGQPGPRSATALS